MEGSSSSDSGGASSESMVELNIKTLDSQIYSFHVDKNMPVSLFKEKIASEIGLPVGQQRLIFRGKVLKDDHLLSAYHVENGHTLHLVVRQPSESQPASGTNSGETSANTGNRGPDANTAAPRNRIGQISHSVVLGTLNVGDQGEGIVPDLTRVIGAVLNSIGLGSQNASNVVGGVQPTMQFNIPVPAPQGQATEGTRNNSGAQGQAGTQAQPGQALPSQFLPQVLQMPLGAAIAVPSLNAPIPDSLHTLSEFMNRMEVVLSQNGYLPNQSPSNSGDRPTTELPTTARGLSTPEALVVVLRHAQRLLSSHTVAALSHIAGRLEQEGSSMDPTVRGQIQTESMQVGSAMQHLGSLLLELGRTILTLRIGQSPAESYVNAGPAVYISPSGPNPIMVQPFPLQTNSLFGGSPVGLSNPGAFGPVGIGAVPRHVNIHIHTAVGPRAPNTEGVQGERVNRTGSGDSGQTRAPSMRNVTATAVPTRPTVTGSSTPQTAASVPQPSNDLVPLSTLVAEVNSRIRNFVDDMRSENQAPSGQAESSSDQNPPVVSGGGNDEGNHQLINAVDKGAGEAREGQKAHLESSHTSNEQVTENGVKQKDLPSGSCSDTETTLKSVVGSECAPRSAQGNTNLDGTTAVPLGLGLGALQPKSRSRQPRSVGRGSGSTTSSAPSQNQQPTVDGHQALQSLASLANQGNINSPSPGQLPPALGQIMESLQMGGQGAESADGNFDAASVMSQVLHTPALNGLLAGVSEQTGIGSPDALKNMLQQFTQNPAMRNTVNQLAQQFDSQDLGSMFSGLGRGQGGGIDLASMVQQMLPIVSQALGGGPTTSRPTSVFRPDPQSQYVERSLDRDEKATDQESQIDLEEVVQRIEHQNPPGEIFRSMAESAANLFDNGSGDDLVNELCCDEGLASEFMEVLGHDLRQRLNNEKGSGEKS
ncbi:ubiquitin-like domain-containing protein CIP73 [Rhododendron vialii]|uniref:ubiquitin-like domain-containing protein CIP73 n=1 Tax=Rhododendron vialii TaxID=182163 RepID=UPI0026600E92|nr:ubiquitin-like domain-containing protein CIP73 [Rhododendron vialii]XP_058220599.1 ubiquitin-like domain-containing protein CIP73 [Rhododendron vialii]XP_058220600.1 ubiquitin-like domain-containing protein CIP73 [Rhododendron vialii]XP_058220601.1 ubiquitin-like domain-containing protein CIP73 [Rhododendron vialii]